MPAPQSIHVDRALSDYAWGVMQDPTEFVSGGFAPITPVDHMSDKYYVLPSEPFLRGDAQIRKAHQESVGSDFELSTDNYNCERYAWHTHLSEDDLNNADNPRLIEEAKVRFVVDNIRLMHEVAFCTSYFKTGVWGTDLVAGTDFTAWSSFGTSDPIKDVETGKRKIKVDGGAPANAILIGYDGWRALKQHPAILNRIGGASNRIVTRELVAALFEVDRIVVAGARKSTNTPGQTAAYDFVFGRNMLLTHMAPNNSNQQIDSSAARIFTWRGTNGPNDGLPVPIARIPRPLNRDVRIEGEINFAHKVTGSKLGVFYSNVVSSTF